MLDVGGLFAIFVSVLVNSLVTAKLCFVGIIRPCKGQDSLVNANM